MRRLVLAVVLVLLAGACSGGDTIRLEATFDDVADLVENAHVRAGDVPIGSIESISLTDDDRARVVLRVEHDTGLPSQVEAVLKRASLLGERFVELRPVNDSGELGEGSVVSSTVVSDLEDLVESGNDLLVGVSADRLAAAVQAGAVAFGGRGDVLGSFLDRLQIFVGHYEAGSQDVVRLIDASDELVAGLAAEAETNAAAIEVLARASRALEEEDDRLLDAVTDLRRLADVTSAILAEHRTEIDNLVRRLRLILEQVLRVDGALQNVLTWLPRHNLHIPNGVLLEMSQVWNDFSVCGLHSERDNPSNSCDPSNPGESNHPPPAYEGPDSCDDAHEGCPYGEGAEPYRPGQDTSASQSGGGGR